MSASAPIQPGPALVVKGSLTYRARVALPPDSRAVIELRDAAAPAGTPVVAEQRIALEGRQVPIPFELSLDRAKLIAGRRYVVRGGILSRGRPAWASSDVPLDVSASSIDVGTLTLTQIAPEPFKSELMCGTERVSVSFERDAAHVVVGAARTT